MSPAKKKSTPAAAAKFPKLTSLFTGWGKFLFIGFLLAGVFAAAGYKIWQFVGGRVLASEEYRLTPEKIQITPLPDWIRTDPRIEVFDNLRRKGPLSLMDDDLVECVAAAFEQNAWVAKVDKVSKQPALVKVDLEYRRPVLMVEIPGGLWPVDAEGTLLPTEGFTSVEAAKYPRLSGVDSTPKTGMGKRWADSRVIGGAEIAAALLPLWEKLRLKRIAPQAIAAVAPESAPLSTPYQSQQLGEYHFEIITKGEKRFFWGRSPVDKNSGDPSPVQKVKKLENLAAEFGSLDDPRCPSEKDLNTP